MCFELEFFSAFDANCNPPIFSLNTLIHGTMWPGKRKHHTRLIKNATFTASPKEPYPASEVESVIHLGALENRFQQPVGTSLRFLKYYPFRFFLSRTSDLEDHHVYTTALLKCNSESNCIFKIPQNAHFCPPVHSCSCIGTVRPSLVGTQ